MIPGIFQYYDWSSIDRGRQPVLFIISFSNMISERLVLKYAFFFFVVLSKFNVMFSKGALTPTICT